MGCSPTKDQNHDHKDKDVYLQPDLDIEAYHFHNFVRDLISVDGNVQRFLNTMYMEWPIPNPSVYKNLTRYGQKYETWPQTHNELLDTIDRTENRLIDTILGDKLRPVAAYLKGAATMKELIHDSEAKSDEITWPDIQYVFRQMLPKIKNGDGVVLLEPKDVPMLDPKISLRYRIPKDMIKKIMEGEWRIYHQETTQSKGATVKDSSYGMMIHDVTQVDAHVPPGSKGGATEAPDVMKGGDDFFFSGGSRLGDKYTISDGVANWNTKGNHGVNLTWVENWIVGPNAGKAVDMHARLKVNGKFECDGLAAAEVKKGSREDNFSTDAHARLKLKYYIGDRDAAFEDSIPFPDICQENFDDLQMEQMMREIFMAWPTVDSPDDFYSDDGDKKPTKIERKGKDIKTWPLDQAKFVELVDHLNANCALIAKPLAKEMLAHTEAKEECMTWPDLQEAFRRAGHGKGDIGREKMCHHKVRLTLKVPENLIKDVLEGEWRMYCKGDGVTNKKPAFSYGMYITDVTEVAHEGHKKSFSFQGRSRVEGKWNVQNGQAFWNEEHTGRVRLDYTEQWAGKGGTCDHLTAHLKVNLKFECDSQCGFIQKARRESTLPDEHHVEERLVNKYYIGDTDAAYEIDPNNVCKFADWIATAGPAGAQEFLTHLFFQWPTLPANPEKVHRYGHKRETWPLTADQVVAAITAGGKYEQKVADGMLTHMFDKNECEACKGETIMWPDFQVIFEHALPDTAKQVKMLEKLEHKPEQHATNLTLKIPESKISECLCGEYRMYCKNVQQDNSFSYGLIIDSVTETGSEDNGFGTQKRTFTFIGRPRLDGKYKLESGTGTWNEFGSGRFHLEYAEHWPDGMVDNLKARLKCNGKFACDSTSGFIQKARKESTLPDELDKRMASKYYIGDQDAAST